MKNISLLAWALAQKRVFVRADLNTPLGGDLFPESLKFQRLLPTLLYLKKSGAQVTLATHIGRPQGFDPRLSTRQLTHYFNQAGLSCIYSTPEHIQPLLEHRHDILLLENMRFYPEEQRESIEFARKITTGCDYFVQDGFGVLGRTETSVVTAAQIFKPEKRSIGLLVKQELDHLRPLKKNPQKPFLLILGGAKGEEKLSIIAHFIGKITHLALLPGVSELIDAQDVIAYAQQQDITVILPEDYIIIDQQKIALGPKSLDHLQAIIPQMQTIVYNGLMGFLENPETTVNTRKLFEMIARSGATAVLAGGDTTQAAQQWHLLGDKLFLSTGGSSTLLYLSGQKLPGLKVVT